MDRIAIKNRTHSQADALSIRNKQYSLCVKLCLLSWLLDDLAKNGDVTSKMVLDDKRASAIIFAKERGVFAGEQEVSYFFGGRIPGTVFKFKKHDGDLIKPRDVVLEITGSAHELLRIERVILNLFSRMSGIATYARHLVELAKKVSPRILITPTRKTLLGLLDKRGCIVGGAGTHRLGLDDAVLIKHNHLKLSGLGIKKILAEAILKLSKTKLPDIKFLEIEVGNVGDALAAAQTMAQAVKNGFKLPCYIMFDNMKPEKIQQAIHKIKRAGVYNYVLFEASGGINEKNIRQYAKTGVDVISVGAMTASAPSLDFSCQTRALASVF